MAEDHCGRKSTKSNRFAKKDTKRARSLETNKAAFRDRSDTMSRESSKESLNTDRKNYASMFLKVCNSFEKALQDLDFMGNSHVVQEKLMKIRDLINMKISLSKISEAKSFDSLLRPPNLSINDLSRSMQSLCSESSCNLDTDNNSDLKKYMSAVNCPFCSEFQSDEISFVKHLDNSCSSHHKKEFKKRNFLPYATFQILPNNTFKCNICANACARNIQYFYLHMQSQAHMLDFMNASKTRNYENLLFCACCKVLVYNNYKQIKSHIINEIHINKCSSKKTSEYFYHKGIHCIFNEANKFKCLDCPPANAVCNSPQSVLEHFNDPQHKKHKKKNVHYSSVIYCEMCLKEVHLIEIISHFNSNEHRENAKKLEQRGFEVCFFCEFSCNNLMDLSVHMESKCAEITAIRQKISEDKENITEGSCIISKNCTKMPELLKDSESANDKDEIKLDNTTDLKLGKSAKMDRTESKGEVSDSSSETSEDDAMTIKDDHLDILFARVSDHLLKTTTKLKSAEDMKIQCDLIQTLRLKNFHFVGFSGSGLSFPSESINIFCGSNRDTFMASTPENLLKMSHIILSDSKLWKNVEYCNDQGPYPCLKCLHKETQRSCTMIVNESSLVLTNMLRECMEKSELVKPFCLIIRFWLSVHELTIRNFEFALISLLVFFLVNLNVVTLSKKEDEVCGLARFFQEKIEVVQPSSQSAKPIVNVKELFQKFLRFIDSFDFDKYCIFLPLRNPIPKSVLLSQSVFKDLPHIKNLKDCSMYIFDPTLGVNLAADIKWQDRNAFLKIVARAVKHYNIK